MGLYSFLKQKLKVEEQIDEGESMDVGRIYSEVPVETGEHSKTKEEKKKQEEVRQYVYPELGLLENTSKNFIEAIKYHIRNSRVIAIYPEAHVWPYYTNIRNFKSVSFKYPIELDKPAYSFTTTYQRKKNGKFKIVTYVDGPFYPDKFLSKKESQEKLKNEIYEAMKKRSKNNNIEIIKYVKRGSND